jgi:multicomponent K+:H+ antiporter subunit G
MTAAALPAWAELLVSVLLVGSGLLTLIGAAGLLRLRSFYARMHAPSLGTTLGTGFLLLASMIVSSVLANRLVVHEVLIGVLIVITSPMTAMLLMRATVYRSRAR